MSPFKAKLMIRAQATARALCLALAAFGLLPIAGCDDIESYDPRQGLVKHVAQAVPGGDQPYPNLGSVPDAAPEVSTKTQRIELQKKLASDTQAKSFTPDSGPRAEIPRPPPPLPPGFVDAQQPMKVADAAPPPAQAQGGAATLPSSTPAFGALGEPTRVAIVLFDAGSSAIDPRQVSRLKPLIESLRSEGGTLQVVGHASLQGDAATAPDKVAKFNLSLDRANMVARALMRLGAKEGQLVVSAEGDSAPTDAAGGVSGDAANQRADIFVEQ
jgi:outer membrane protein OmpA-like peptidoglycan-associated protein